MNVQSNWHKNAVKVVVTLPKTPKDVVEMLSSRKISQFIISFEGNAEY